MPSRSLSDPARVSTFAQLFAHRGSRLLAPENTIAAFDLALACGADVLETDVRLSRDNVVIVTHDQRVDRTTNGTGAVREHTREALATLNAGYRHVDAEGNLSFRDQGLSLLTLHELFERYPQTGINIDIKDADPVAAEAVAQVLVEHAHHPWCNVGSFHAEVIQHFRRIAPEVTTAASQDEVARLYFLRNRAEPTYQYLQIPPRYAGLPLDTRRFISHANRRGVAVVYWTINDPLQMRRLLERGAQGIVTDRPDLAAPLFAEFRQRAGK